MSMGAVPGTGPSTGPLTVVRKVSRKTFADLPTDRTLVMGILNVTDNSFSDGGEHFDTNAAIDHGLRMHYNGADIVDVGGESTAPGNPEVDVETEKKRILPVVEALVKAGALVSVDTRHVETARAVLEISKDIIINDVSGLNYAAEMPALIAETGAKYIVMHNRGNSQDMDSKADYDSLVAEVVGELRQITSDFEAAGVAADQLIVDPGLGFSKVDDQNWQLLQNLEQITALGYPVLVAGSRKRFLGTLLADSDGSPADPAERDAATAALSALAAAQQVWAVRVHDVPGTVDAVKAATAWVTGHAEHDDK